MSDGDIKEVNFKKDKMAGNVEAIKREFENLVGVAVEAARLRKAAYDKYIELGFDEDQSLELCKQPFLKWG